MSKIVLALGGNAITAADKSVSGQRKTVAHAAKCIVDLLIQGNQLVITHGNGPQVGNLLLKNPMPVDTAVAMTQGEIGFWLQHALDCELQRRRINKKAVAVVTQVKVKSDDPAFADPTKPIGPFFSAQEVKQEKKRHPENVYREDAGRGYRQVVASPKPVKIVEAALIKQMLDQGYIPIASGGGGIPFIEQAAKTNAVIDKDYAAAKLAENIAADKLVILTTVDNAYLHYGQPQQQALKKISIASLKEYLKQGEFAPGSMKPKIEACLAFTEKTGKPSIITSLNQAGQLDQGVGTIIEK